jgi:hypothetical protein
VKRIYDLGVGCIGPLVCLDFVAIDKSVEAAFVSLV